MAPSKIDLAIKFCKHYHDNQFRKSNNLPYHTHPLAVANILEKYGYADEITQCVAILHDTREDTPLRIEEIYESFGYEVANGVYVLSKNTIDTSTRAFA